MAQEQPDCDEATLCLHITTQLCTMPY